MPVSQCLRAVNVGTAPAAAQLKQTAVIAADRNDDDRSLCIIARTSAPKHAYARSQSTSPINVQQQQQTAKKGMEMQN